MGACMTLEIGILIQFLYMIILLIVIGESVKCFLFTWELCKKYLRSTFFISKKQLKIYFKIANSEMYNNITKIDKQASMKVLQTLY